ncbi:hypothetical protein J6590_033667 [Homalodisca vitripennis]|nr:hypothetical protein J6590_033667 [Homalodisca vitripennis]
METTVKTLAPKVSEKALEMRVMEGTSVTLVALPEEPLCNRRLLLEEMYLLCCESQSMVGETVQHTCRTLVGALNNGFLLPNLPMFLLNFAPILLIPSTLPAGLLDTSVYKTYCTCCNRFRRAFVHRKITLYTAVLSRWPIFLIIGDRCV